MDEMPLPEILSEAIAKRRLAIYVAIRLAGIGLLFAGVWLLRSRPGAGGIMPLFAGAASLFLRPRMLAKLFGPRW